MSKASDMYVFNGIIYNQIMDIIAKNTLNRVDSCLVVCADDEVFEQAMLTVINKYPHATGVVSKADSGVRQAVYRSDIWIEHSGIPGDEESLPNASTITDADAFPRTAMPRYRNHFYVVTDAIYKANQAEIDGMDLGVKHFIASTGGAY